jgi:hypothetical protein
VGIAAGGDGALDADGLRVVSVSPDSAGRFGRGISIEDRASAIIRQAVIEDAQEAQVFSSGELVLENTVVRGSRNEFFPSTASTLRAEDGGRIELRRAFVHESAREGVAGSSSSHLVLEDVVIVDTDGESVRSSNFTAVELRRVTTRAGAWPALLLSGSAATVQGWVATEAFAQGIAVAGGTTFGGTGLVIDGAPTTGLNATGEDTSLDLEDIIVVDTGPDELGSFGRGINIQQGANAALRRARLDGARDTGLFVSSAGTSLTGEDISIQDVSGRAGDGRGGAGLLVQSGARVSIVRAAVRRARGHGVLALNAESVLNATELLVEDVDRHLCATSTCADSGRGVGVATYRSGAVDVSSFVVRGATLCGAAVAADGSLDLEFGLIEDTEIGLCVLVPDYDFDRLTGSVRMRDVARSVDSPTLPVPDVEPDTGDP